MIKKIGLSLGAVALLALAGCDIPASADPSTPKRTSLETEATTIYVDSSLGITCMNFNTGSFVWGDCFPSEDVPLSMTGADAPRVFYISLLEAPYDTFLDSSADVLCLYFDDFGGSWGSCIPMANFSEEAQNTIRDSATLRR